MLSLAWSFSKASFIPGLCGLLFSAIYSFITCNFIISACEQTQTFEYSALLKFVYPKYLETAAAIILIYICLSSCLSYIILFADFFTIGIQGFGLQFKYD